MLKEYLALPQIKHKLKSLYKSEQQVNNWWLQHREQFPNLEVMARQYLGCPATSASVERLFSKVGVAFSAKRKNSEAETLANIMFANAKTCPPRVTMPGVKRLNVRTRAWVKDRV